jgi:hypothetical protein
VLAAPRLPVGAVGVRASACRKTGRVSHSLRAHRIE